jgi:hypothetical protein
MHCSRIYFGKELYMFQTDLLSIIRSLNTVYTATGICHASYVDSVLARSGYNWYILKIEAKEMHYISNLLW